MFPYSTMLQPLFWMIMGLLTGIFLLSLHYWMQDLKIAMNWWKWTLLLFWLFLVAVIVGAGFTLIGEGEGTAGKRFMAFFGVMLLLTGSGLWKLLKKT